MLFVDVIPLADVTKNPQCSPTPHKTTTVKLMGLKIPMEVRSTTTEGQTGLMTTTAELTGLGTTTAELVGKKTTKASLRTTNV